MGILSKFVSKALAKKTAKKTVKKETKKGAEEATASRVKNTNPPGQGKRFSDRENTQKGSTDSRKVTAKGTTNKNDRMPAFTGADVFKDQAEDIRVLRKSKTANDKVPANLREQAESARKAAKGRAASRTGVRAAVVTASPIAGYAAADYANEKMKKPAPSKGTIKITGAADERKNKEDYPTYKKGTGSSTAFRKAFKTAKDDGAKTFTFEGRKYNTAEKK